MENDKDFEKWWEQEHVEDYDYLITSWHIQRIKELCYRAWAASNPNRVNGQPVRICSDDD